MMTPMATLINTQNSTYQTNEYAGLTTFNDMMSSLLQKALTQPMATPRHKLIVKFKNKFFKKYR